MLALTLRDAALHAAPQDEGALEEPRSAVSKDGPQARSLLPPRFNSGRNAPTRPRPERPAGASVGGFDYSGADCTMWMTQAGFRSISGVPLTKDWHDCGAKVTSREVGPNRPPRQTLPVAFMCDRKGRFDVMLKTVNIKESTSQPIGLQLIFKPPDRVRFCR